MNKGGYGEVMVMNGIIFGIIYISWRFHFFIFRFKTKETFPTFNTKAMYARIK
jgi:hypothetical protein